LAPRRRPAGPGLLGRRVVRRRARRAAAPHRPGCLCRPGPLGAAPRPAGPGGAAPIAAAPRPGVSARWAEARAGVAPAPRGLAVRITQGKCGWLVGPHAGVGLGAP